MDAREKPAQDHLVSPPTAAPPRSLRERALRWLSGTDRREKEAAEQARIQAEQTAALERAQAEAHAQAERQRLARAAHAAAQAEVAHEAQQESVRAAAVSLEPLIEVATSTGGRYHIKRDEWLAARKQSAQNVPLCRWNGEPPGEGERAKLRLSTIEDSILTPVRIVAVADLLPEQDQPSLEPNIGL